MQDISTKLMIFSEDLYVAFISMESMRPRCSIFSSTNCIQGNTAPEQKMVGRKGGRPGTEHKQFEFEAVKSRLSEVSSQWQWPLA